MSHLVLVRHGRAAAAWDEHGDPGLDEAGVRQAEAMAAALVLFGPLPIVTSPLRRCLETAAALATRWGVEAAVEPAVGEVPSPTLDLLERGRWLRSFMAGSWDEQPAELVAWRGALLDAVRRLGEHDGVVVTHFIAINAVVGEATGDRRVVCFSPDNCSRTEIRVDNGEIELVELGEQARTIVQ